MIATSSSDNTSRDVSNNEEFGTENQESLSPTTDKVSAVDYSTASINNITSTTRTTMEPTVEDLDAQIFGKDTNENLADALTAFCLDTMKEGVRNLPLFNKTAPSTEALLLERLRKPYLKNIDIIEAYGSHRIFTMANLSTAGDTAERSKSSQISDLGFHHRQAIVDRFLGKTTDGVGNKLIDQVSIEKSAADATVPISMDQIPKKEDLLRVENELEDLMKQFHQAQLRRKALQQEVNNLKTTDALTKKLNQVVTEQDSGEGKTMSQTIQNIAESGQTLQRVHEVAQKLQTDLIHEKNEQKRGGDYGDENLLIESLPSTKKRILTMDEQYEKERRAIRIIPGGLQEFINNSQRKSAEQN